jgi:hypothetical protein
MTIKNKILYVVIGCDTDPDRKSFVDNDSDEGKSWRGVTNGIPLFKDIAKDIKDSHGNAPRITWLLRADEQIRNLYGDYAWVLRNFEKLFKDLQADGDELGWHPHFYRLEPSSTIWYQEIFDVAWQKQMLDEAYKAYSNVIPGRPVSVRMGWDFHNDSTLSKLAELGIKIDFSALPGLRTNLPKRGEKAYNVYDWINSPRHPYWPSDADYRRPPMKGEGKLPILELPIFASTSIIWGLIGGLQMARKMKDPSQFFQAIKRPTFVINITGKPKYFSPIASELSRILARTDKSVIFATYFHADELLDNKSSIYSRFNLRDNLKTLQKICVAREIKLEFITAEKTFDVISVS